MDLGLTPNLAHVAQRSARTGGEAASLASALLEAGLRGHLRCQEAHAKARATALVSEQPCDAATSTEAARPIHAAVDVAKHGAGAEACPAAKAAATGVSAAVAKAGVP